MTGHRDVAAGAGGDSDAPRTRLPIRPLVTTGIAIVGAATLLILRPGAEPPTVTIPAPSHSAETSTWLGDSLPVIAGEVPGETMFKLPSPSYLGRGVTARSQTSELRIDPGHPDDADEATLDALFGGKTPSVESRIIHLPDRTGSGGADSALPGVDDWRDLLGDGPSALDLLNPNGLRTMIDRTELLIGKGVDAALDCTGPGCERADSGILFGSGGDDAPHAALEGANLFVPVDVPPTEFGWGGDGQLGTNAAAGGSAGDAAAPPTTGIASEPATTGDAGSTASTGAADPAPTGIVGDTGGHEVPTAGQSPASTPEVDSPGAVEGPPGDGPEVRGDDLRIDGGADLSEGPPDESADGSAESGTGSGADSGVTSGPGGAGEGGAGGPDQRPDQGQSQDRNSGPDGGQDSGSPDSSDGGE
ncbi:hypothetical protein [Mycolicibacterium thermoresistibile]